jgi:hypothetical protein
MSIEDLWRGTAEPELRAEVAHLRQLFATAIEMLQIMEEELRAARASGRRGVPRRRSFLGCPCAGQAANANRYLVARITADGSRGSRSVWRALRSATVSNPPRDRTEVEEPPFAGELDGRRNRPGMKLPRFRGHRMICVRGVHDVQDERFIPT